eukprot:TRINITY_DN2614_c0_g2_i1.p1 TRINITY_DN2614_c0_g2~~TRINITY_DN2614_c0_g2_i1.p1  ORF type:complete len:302 (-),score=75.15 TRINITY_DN2614_c0_g2_i1:62-934(-)
MANNLPLNLLTLNEDSDIEIRDIWANDDWESHLEELSRLVNYYPYIAVDTEFPGFTLPSQAYHEFPSNEDFAYAKITNSLKTKHIIQVGFCICDERGNFPPPNVAPAVWQFNFSFDVSFEPQNDSIKLLEEAGLDFEKHRTMGINQSHFGASFMSSSLCFNPNISWVAFHSGFDFAYLLKTVLCPDVFVRRPNATNPVFYLPETYEEFIVVCERHFPRLYDLKFTTNIGNNGYGGFSLSRLGKTLNLQRYGTAHQAGSDSLLTLQIFLTLKQSHEDVFLLNFVNYNHPFL